MSLRKTLGVAMFVALAVFTLAARDVVFGQGGAAVVPSISAARSADEKPAEPAKSTGVERPVPVATTPSRRGSSRAVPTLELGRPSSNAPYSGQGGLPYRSVRDDSLYGYRLRQADPELDQLLAEDDSMEQQTQQVAQQYRQEKDEAKRAELRQTLEQLTAQHFDLRQKRRQREVAQLEKQLERIRAAIEKRNEVQNLIIQRRVARLLGEEDDLAF